MSIRFDVVSNALDFLSSAADSLRSFQDSGDPRDVKYGLLHLSSAIELLMKQKLAEQHWSLVFQNVNQASLQAFESGDFRSCNLEDALSRLSSICDIAIDSSHSGSIKVLRKLRNKVEHFQFEVTREQGLAVCTRAWSFTLEFVQSQLITSFVEKQKSEWERIRGMMMGVEEFVKERGKEVEKQIEKRDLDWYMLADCPFCMERALFVDEDERVCLFCRYTDDRDAMFAAWMEAFYGGGWDHPKERMIHDPVEQCPSCGESFFVKDPRDGGMAPPDPEYFCFSCGNWERPSVECSNCEQEFTPEDWEDFPWVCAECKSGSVEADNQEGASA